MSNNKGNDKLDTVIEFIVDNTTFTKDELLELSVKTVCKISDSLVKFINVIERLHNTEPDLEKLRQHTEYKVVKGIK